jgi:hypothetical protein
LQRRNSGNHLNESHSWGRLRSSYQRLMVTAIFIPTLFLCFN